MELKKGMLFTYDGIIAAMLLMIAVSLISSYFIVEEKTDQAEYMSFDSISFLSDITMSELNQSELDYYMNQSNVTYPDNTILEQIGFYWVKNQTYLSKNLSKTIMSKYIPKRYGFKVLVAGEEIFSRNTTKKTSLVTTKQMVSGIEKFKPLRGSTGKVFLTGIGGKFISSYMYFGGFIGQGNVSKKLLTIPSDANVTDMYLELDAGEAFRLYINSNLCSGPASDDTYIPDTGNMTSDGWDITACKDFINPGGSNDFLFEFNSSVLDRAYIGGGYLRVSYKTAKLGKSELENYTRIYLPAVNGIINLYSSFYVPGNITNMEVNLHYFANNTINETLNNTFYLKIGNTTVYSDQNTSTKTILLSNSTLGTALNYSLMSKQNIPLRLGFENLSYNEIFEGNADVVIITDISGSMDWRMDNDNAGTARNCDNSDLNLSSTSRISVAKCLDKQFVEDILNITGNKVGLVAYESYTHNGETVTPTLDETTLDNTIGIADPQDGYNAGGGTCICCGINSAVDELTKDMKATTLIDLNSDWLYNNFSLTLTPPVDGSSREWYELNYANEGSWHSGLAILGSTNSDTYSPFVNTEMGYELSSVLSYVDLWENAGDVAGPPLDFSSGVLNTTGNTFGINGADDGWDWDLVDSIGPFGYDDNITYPGVVGGRLELNNSISGSNICGNFDCSGAYGIRLNITDADYALIASGAGAKLSFDWFWRDNSGSMFEGANDQVWVKGQWISKNSGTHYLGKQLDDNHNPNDGTPEIASIENPNLDASGTYSQGVSDWIEGPGAYYLILGGKIRASESIEIGTWAFDNIMLEISDPDHYYFRKHFNLILNPTYDYIDLWENAGDVAGPPMDFGSGVLNSSGNTYGLTGADDGWDWDDDLGGSGPFGFDDVIDYNQIVGGRLEMDNRDGWAGNTCTDTSCSGAYGIRINITDADYARILANDQLRLEFDWYWEAGTNEFEATGTYSDQVWIKARWSGPSGSHYIGTNLDINHSNPDAELEIASIDNPDSDTSGSFSGDISQWIESAGTYYLEIGGKIFATASDEYGTWAFDNIQLKLGSANYDNIKRGMINIVSDDQITAYLNGNEIFDEPRGEKAKYWNEVGIHVPGEYFREGDNVLAVELTNGVDAAKFDLELIGFNDTRQKAMMVMTDGEANVQCGRQATGDSSADAIKAACQAKEDWGITVYAVGYSDNADMPTISGMAECGSGLSAKSSDISELEEFYKDVAYGIISASRRSQVIELEGTGGTSELFWDSYIDINYTSPDSVDKFGKIFLNYETDQFDSCTESVSIPSELIVTEAALKSYSSEHWTDNVTVNSNQVFLLSDYGEEYSLLGDPFKIEIPPEYIASGSLNTITMNTGDSLTTSYNCSPNNTMIYGGYADMQFTFENVMELADGCNWTIEYEDGMNVDLQIPETYAGAKNCNYTNASVSYNPSDIYDVMIYALLDKLDLDDDRRLDINLNESLLNINILEINEVPYMWGPTMVEVQVWQ